MHLKGRKHLAKVSELSSSKNPGGEPSLMKNRTAARLRAPLHNIRRAIEEGGRRCRSRSMARCTLSLKGASSSGACCAKRNATAKT